MTILTAVIGLLGCSGVLLMMVAILMKVWQRRRVATPASTSSSRVSTTDYRMVSGLLTPTERVYYTALCQVLPDGYVCMVQVALNRVVEVPGLRRADPWRDPRWNRISQKSLDFVVVRMSDSCPVVAIELDDASHQRPDRQRRDETLDAILASAGLPIIHQPVLPVYDMHRLQMQVFGYFDMTIKR